MGADTVREEASRKSADADKRRTGRGMAANSGNIVAESSVDRQS